jgi:heme/copper-type cytochrome/quinol oxidase subunit 3
VSTLEEGTKSHHLPPALIASQQRRAVLFFILADAIFFACMIFTYFYLRSLNVDNGWLPSGASTAQTWLTWLIAGITIVSALVYRAAELSIREGQRSRFLSAGLLGIILVVISAALIIYQTRTWPILMSDGSYASVFTVMTGVQFVHLLVLLFVGFGIWNRGIQGKYDDGATNHVTLVGYFWSWVALTALLGACTTFFV